MDSEQTDFGFEQVNAADKKHRVSGVFDSVASRYDLMNDLMSLGMHRLWKSFALDRCILREGERVLDIAGGSVDLTAGLARKVGANGEVWLTDINASMLRVGRDRLINRGLLLPAVQCDAERLPFPNRHFDCVTVGFGLRNMTDKAGALHEMTRVLRPGGRLIVLEFSQVWEPLAGLYDQYSFGVLPWLGERIAGDAASYRYLAESIRMHPDQNTLAAMMEHSGLADVQYWNLAGGIVAVHRGIRYT